MQSLRPVRRVAELGSLGVMRILIIISVSLVIWWVAFSLLVVRDHMRRARSPRPQPVLPPEELAQLPRWPAWRDCFTRRALLSLIRRPTLLFIIPWVLLIHGVLFLLIWPCFPIHRAFRPDLFTPPDDDAA